MRGNTSTAALNGTRTANAVDGRTRARLATCLAPPLPWAVLTFTLVTAAGWPATPPLIADSIAYRALALGRAAKVPGSISGRILHPAFARVVSWATGANIDQAFWLVALVTLALLIGTVSGILRQTVGFGALVLPLLFTPVLVKGMFGLYYCQDLFYAALLACLFAALLKNHKWIGLAMLLPLFLTRESTVLVALVWAAIAWFESDFVAVGACIGVTIVGLGLSRLFAALGQPNVHHTNELVFLALKPPFDSLRNLLGIVLVPDEMKGRPGYTCASFAVVHLPRYLQYGFTRRVGICRPEPILPLRTLMLWLSLFGIGPAIFFEFFRCSGRRLLTKTSLCLKLAAIYGLLTFLIAPFVSEWLERDIGYAWPAFWLAAPAIFKQLYPTATLGVAVALMLENLCACWIPYTIATLPSAQEFLLMIALGVALAAQAAALWTLRSRALHAGSRTGHPSRWGIAW
jgi:hypothetical protein